MDTLMPDADAVPPAAEAQTRTEHDQEETERTAAPPPASSDTTGLSSAPPTDSEPKESDVEMISVQKDPAAITENTNLNGIQPAQAALASQTSAQVSGPGTTAEALPSTAGAEPTLSMATPAQFAVPAAPASGSVNNTPRGRGRGGRPPGRPRLSTNGGPTHNESAIAKSENGTPVSGRGRGRGRGGGRPRGSGRGRGAARGGKRKRSDEDDDGDGNASDSSVEITPVATATRSGRSVQKPTTFVPPPPSPTTNKKKRAYNHRNPQAAVCKVCLRGTSPASNPVVFCDGCNAPYHRWCHKPPIEQVVIDKEDAEWYCQQCAASRIVPVAVTEVSSFVSVQGASEDQRRKYFASLPQGMLVTLLVKATTFRPDLPVFDSKFKDQLFANVNGNGNGAPGQPFLENKGKEPASLHRQPSAVPSRDNSASVPPRSNGPNGLGPSPDDAGYTSDVHPENYPRPGQGLMSTLPPESGDLEWLVDDENDNTYGTFTHLYHEPARAGAAIHSGDGLV